MCGLNDSVLSSFLKVSKRWHLLFQLIASHRKNTEADVQILSVTEFMFILILIHTVNMYLFFS